MSRLTGAHCLTVLNNMELDPTGTQSLPDRRRPTLTGFSFIVGPLCLLTAWVIMWPFGGRLGPGLGWNAAHVVWVVGFLLIGVLSVGLYRLAAPRTTAETLTAKASVIVALLSVFTSLVQMIVDLVVGFQAKSKAEMSAMFTDFRELPGVRPAFYTVGPRLLFFALTALAVLVVLRRTGRTIGFWVPVLVAGGPLLLLFSDNRAPLAPIGLACFCLALAPLGWQLMKGQVPPLRNRS